MSEYSLCRVFSSLTRDPKHKLRGIRVGTRRVWNFCHPGMVNIIEEGTPFSFFFSVIFRGKVTTKGDFSPLSCTLPFMLTGNLLDPDLRHPGEYVPKR